MISLSAPFSRQISPISLPIPDAPPVISIFAPAILLMTELFVIVKISNHF
jgi:hypothetical protein